MSDEDPSTSSVGGEIVAGLLGAAVALGCALPPVVHLLTGPLGPFIGGFVAGSRVKPGARGRVIIAGVIGTGLAGVIGTVALLLRSLATKGELPSWFPSSGGLGAILGGVFAYGAIVGGVGATVSGSMGGKSEGDRAP